MLSNFKKRLLFCRSSLPQEQRTHTVDTAHPEQVDHINDSVVQQHWATAMAETVHIPGCTCPFCTIRSETDEAEEPMDTPSRSLPSIRSVMEVLYPPSYLGVPSSLPDPPSYSSSDPRQDSSEVSLFASSTTTSIDGDAHSDPLAQDPSISGVPVPSQGIPSSRALLAEPNLPVPEEPLPAYSRFDQRRPRFPTASNILGPYPPPSVLLQSSH